LEKIKAPSHRPQVTESFEKLPSISTSSVKSKAAPREGGRKKTAKPAGEVIEVIDTEGVIADDAPVRSRAKTARGRDAAPALEPTADSEAEDDEDEDEDEDSEERDDDVIADVEGEPAIAEFSDDDDGELSESTALVPVAAGSRALSINDPLAAYMREVQRHPLLTREEEHQLAVVYHETGDVDAAKKLVTSNLRLVVKIAYEYKRAHRNMMDLVQEGNIGLMQAVRRYDPHRGVKLSSYSAWWIRAYILRFILNNWRLVKLGTTQAQRKLFFNLNKERARLAALGIEPTYDEIARRLDVDSRDVQEMDLRLASNDASLDVPIGDSDGKSTTRLDLLPAAGDSPERLAENEQLMGMLREHLGTFRETLSGKDVEIFDKRMVAEEPVTLQELGDHFGVSRERVRQLEARISGKLRTFLYQCLGDAVAEEQP
jgi:RNA polymerase sigma-32 factor